MDEISNLMKTRWNQDLDISLFSNSFASTIDNHMLGCLVEQFFHVIILNKNLSSSRDFNKGLRRYTREIVKKARSDMKISNDLAWKRYPGWYHIESVTTRKQLLEENKKKFYKETDWNKLLDDFKSYRWNGKDRARMYGKTNREFENQFNKDSIPPSERWEDVMDEDEGNKASDNDMAQKEIFTGKKEIQEEEIEEEGEKNEMQNEIFTGKKEIQKGEIEEEGEKNEMPNEITQFHEVMQEAVTYKIWSAALKQETVISDDTKQKIIKCMSMLQSTIKTTTVTKIDAKLDRVLENFRNTVMRTPFTITNTNRNIMSVCYLELIRLTNEVKSARETLTNKNMIVLKKKLKELSDSDYSTNMKFGKEFNLKSEDFSTAYINPYLI